MKNRITTHHAFLVEVTDTFDNKMNNYDKMVEVYFWTNFLAGAGRSHFALDLVSRAVAQYRKDWKQIIGGQESELRRAGQCASDSGVVSRVLVAFKGEDMITAETYFEATDIVGRVGGVIC